MRSLRFAILAVVLLLPTACLPFLHPGSVDREVEGTYTQVFQATLEELEERGFPIKGVDRDEGTIVTGNRPVWLIETYRRVEKAEAQIEEDDGEVEVSLLLSFVDQVSGKPLPVPDDGDDDRADDVLGAAFDRTLSASAIYDEYLDAIEDRVEEMRNSPVADEE